MKNLIYAGLGVFTLGFIAKFFHIHFNTFIMLGGTLLILISIISALIKKDKLGAL